MKRHRSLRFDVALWEAARQAASRRRMTVTAWIEQAMVLALRVERGEVVMVPPDKVRVEANEDVGRSQ